MYCLSEEQKQLKRTVKKFVEEEICPVAPVLDRSGAFPTTLVGRCGELGFGNTLFTIDAAGRRYGALDGVVIIEELSRGLGSLGLIMCPHYQCCDLIAQAADEELKQAVLAPGMRCDKIFAYALSEASGGSDALGIDTTAIRSGDSWVLNGAKCWITNAAYTDGYIVAAKTSAYGRSRSVSLFYVDKNSPGLSISENEKMIGMHNSPIGTVRFEDCQIPINCLIGVENEGYRLIKQALNEGRLSLSAVAIGIAQRAMELSTEYSSSVGQYGRSLSSYQGISFKIADMYTNIAAARYMLYHVASICDMQVSYTAEAAALKLFSTEMCCSVCKDARQIHGANGLTRSFEVDRCFRDSQMLTIAEGTSEICKIIVSNAMYHSKIDDYS
jgi:butyryl-CoA dehydrogenase